MPFPYNLYDLPTDILRHIYSFDDTYRDKYDVVVAHLEQLNGYSNGLFLIERIRSMEIRHFFNDGNNSLFKRLEVARYAPARIVKKDALLRDLYETMYHLMILHRSLVPAPPSKVKKLHEERKKGPYVRRWFPRY